MNENKHCYNLCHYPQHQSRNSKISDLIKIANPFFSKWNIKSFNITVSQIRNSLRGIMFWTKPNFSLRESSKCVLRLGIILCYLATRFSNEMVKSFIKTWNHESRLGIEKLKLKSKWEKVSMVQQKYQELKNVKPKFIKKRRKIYQKATIIKINFYVCSFTSFSINCLCHDILIIYTTKSLIHKEISKRNR